MPSRERSFAFEHRVGGPGGSPTSSGGFRRPPAGSAPVTHGIVGLCVAVFALEILLAGQLTAVVAVPPPVLLRVGGNLVALTLKEHRYETLLASAFVHGSALHLLMNMAVLRSVGPLVEGEVGSARVAPLYLVSAVAASAASCVAGIVVAGQRLSVGASGAILGLVGAAFVIGVRTDGFRGPLARASARWLAMLVGFGFVAALFGVPIDNAAHVGGALGGMAVASLWRRDYVYTPLARAVSLVASGVVLGLVAAAVRARA